MTVFENLEPLKLCLTELQHDDSSSDLTVREATGLLLYLNTPTFIFWLNLFYKIMPHIEILYNVMQSRALTALAIHYNISQFKNKILEIRNSPLCENSSLALQAESKEVCDNICMDIEERYSFSGHIIAAKLFNKNNIAEYKNGIPTQVMDEVVNAYPFLDRLKLTSEFLVFYGREDLQKYKTMAELLQFITTNGLIDALSEIFKLVNILLTIPMSTAEAERCFSTLKRVKTLPRCTMLPDRLNGLSVLTVEKMFLQQNPHIKDEVTQLFISSKNRRMEFTYK